MRSMWILVVGLAVSSATVGADEAWDATVTRGRGALLKAKRALDGQTPGTPGYLAQLRAIAACEAELTRATETLATDCLKLLASPEWKVRVKGSRRLHELLPEALPAMLRAVARPGANPDVVARINQLIGGVRVDAERRIRQWAASARGSTEYSPTGCSAAQAAGPPNTKVAGDQPTAWAPREQDAGIQTLEVTFRYPVYPAGIRIHETCAPGAVVRVEARDAVGAWTPLWKGTSKTRETIRYLELSLPPTVRPVTSIRIVLDTASVPGWNEVDAVELLGVLTVSNAQRKAQLDRMIAARRKAIEARRKEVAGLEAEIAGLRQRKQLIEKPKKGDE